MRILLEDSERQQHREMEELRSSFMELCAAVRGDMRELEHRMGQRLARLEEVVQRRQSQETATATGGSSVTQAVGDHGASTTAVGIEVILRAVRGAPASSRRELARMLLPELQQAIREEVQTLNADRCTAWERQSDETERRIRLYVEQQQQATQARVQEAMYANLPVEFSSTEAFDAHMRAAARAVLAEEDAVRYQTASEVESRVQRYTQQQQKFWRQSLDRVDAEWRAYVQDLVHHERHLCVDEDVRPLQQQVEVVNTAVQQITKDLRELSRQQGGLLSVVEELEKHPPTSSLVVAKSVSDLRGPNSSDTSSSTIDQLRLEVMQPALEHTRRLLAAHQKMIDAMVEQRCGRAEQAAQDIRQSWAQKAAELRSNVMSLRGDVRGALAQLCEGLNVACPGL